MAGAIMGKRFVAEAFGLGALVLSGYFLVQAYWPKADLVNPPKTYVVYRDRVHETEKVVVKNCVPIEVVVPKEGTVVPNSGSMFPLNLGSLTVQPLPYGGEVVAGLEEHEGAGRLFGTVVPNARPRFEWLGTLDASLGAGMALRGGIVTQGSLALDLFRWNRMTLGLLVEGRATEKEGSDLQALLNARFRLNTRK